MRNNNYFGVLLDVSRNGVLKVDEVKKYLKTLSGFGYNMCMLYTEDTYEVKDEPYFGYLRGRYSISEIQEMDEYAKTIGVELIPCIQTLGHLETLFKWNTYKTTVWDIDNILLCDNERTYTLIENMFKSLRQAYSSKKIHIGMDEAHHVGAGKYFDKHGYVNRFELVCRHLNKVIELARKYDFEPIMWSDMFFRAANKGEYFEKVDFTEEQKALVPKDVGLVFWDYVYRTQEYFKGMFDSHKQIGKDIWFAGTAFTYQGICPCNIYSINTLKADMQACRASDVNNVIVTVWATGTADGKECSFWTVLPSLFCARKFYDGEFDMDKIKAEFKEITGEDMDVLNLLDIPNDFIDNKDFPLSVTKAVLYNDILFGFWDSAYVEGEEEKFKKSAEILRANANKTKFSYLFEEEALLCDICYVKYSLGIRARKAYKSGDKKELINIVNDIDYIREKLSEFYELFKKIFFMENKPHGFETQELYLGGLMLRWKSVRDRITDYVDGKVDALEELEEQIIDYLGGGDKFTITAPNSLGCKTDITVNRI